MREFANGEADADHPPARRNSTTLENNLISQNETKEKPVTVEDIESLSTIEILRRLGQESKD